MSRGPRTAALVLGLAAAAAATTAALAAGVTQRVSLGPGGAEPNGPSIDPALSARGRFVAFVSFASNLVPGDTNNAKDIFVHDRLTRTTRRVSVRTGGAQADGPSSLPAVSADGRFVAFESAATNLVPGDTNRVADIFVHDQRTARTERVSVATGGGESNGDSAAPALSPGARYVAFLSRASNLVPGDANDVGDVFVHDRRTGTTRRVSVSRRRGDGNGDSGIFRPDLTAGARYVAFASFATNLVPMDTNAEGDVFVRDLRTKRTELESVGPRGVQGDFQSYGPVLSADGRLVAFESFATNLVAGETNIAGNVFVRDRLARVTVRVGAPRGSVEGDGSSFAPAISADGRVVAFSSTHSNLVPGDTNEDQDVFVRDLRTGAVRRVSVGRGGVEANGFSLTGPGALSADGRTVTFYSDASNLVPGDRNGVADVFVHGW